MRVRGRIDWVKVIAWLVILAFSLFMFWQLLSWIDTSFMGRIE